MTFIKLDISSFSFRNRVDSGDATTTRTSQIYTFNRVKHSVLHERLSFYKFHGSSLSFHKITYFVMWPR